MGSFFLGIGTGIVLTIPLAAVYVWREGRRVRRLAQRARAAERLAELGTLTGGLAHEIKNPLSTIGLNIQLLQEDLREIASQLPPTETGQDRLGRLQRRFDSLAKEIHRLRDILEDFLRFAGRIKLDRVETDLSLLIDELVDFFTPQAAAAGIHLRTQRPAQPVRAWVDPNLLKQAMLNLLLNATQAMVEARDRSDPSGGNSDLIIHLDHGKSLGQREVCIHVIDTGPGIPAERMARIFQPYFSTKRGGTGLGLPTARRIVEEHGGTLSVHSEIGRGTDFTLRLPAHNPATDTQDRSPQAK